MINGGLVIVSLFNGMNTGREAFENQGFKVERYYSSEIKKAAIELTQHHRPDTIQLGDVTKWKEWNIPWDKVDVILSGSPCQDLSGAGKRAGINGDRSSLFFEFVSMYEKIKALNPHVVFLQENVGSASKLDIGIMSRALGLYPARINSELVVAQQRDRYYWTNIKTKNNLFDVVTDIPEPEDRNIYLSDIIETGYVDRYKARAILESESRPYQSKILLFRRYKEKGFSNIVYEQPTGAAVRGRKNESGKTVQTIEVNVKQKANCITTVDKDSMLFYVDDIRSFTKKELCRLQGFPDDYCDTISRNQAGSLLGDGWTLPMIEYIISFYKPAYNELLKQL